MSSTSCPYCSAEIRYNQLPVHIKKSHSSDFMNDIFRFNADLNQLTFKALLKDTVNILQGEIVAFDLPTQAEEEIFIDFGTNVAYQKKESALKNIMTHPEKHQENMWDLIYSSLTKEMFIKMCNFMLNKPTEVFADAYIEKRYKDLKAKYDELERTHNSLVKPRELSEEEQNDKLQCKIKDKIIDELNCKNYELQQIVNDLKRRCNETEEHLFSVKSQTLQEQEQEMSLIAKLRLNSEKEIKEIFTKKTKEVEKLKADFEKEKEKLEKDLKKVNKKLVLAKNEIMILKQELKFKAKMKASSSDSDSDSSDSD